MKNTAIKPVSNRQESVPVDIVQREQQRQLAYDILNSWYGNAINQSEEIHSDYDVNTIHHNYDQDKGREQEYLNGYDEAVQETFIFFYENPDRLLGIPSDKILPFIRSTFAHKFAQYRFWAGTRGRTHSSPDKYWQHNLNKGMSRGKKDQDKSNRIPYAYHRKILSYLPSRLIPVYILHTYLGISQKNVCKRLSISRRTFFNRLAAIKDRIDSIPIGIGHDGNVIYWLDTIKEKYHAHNIQRSSLSGYEEGYFFLKRIDSPNNGARLSIKNDVKGCKNFSITFPFISSLFSIPLKSVSDKCKLPDVRYKLPSGKLHVIKNNILKPSETYRYGAKSYLNSKPIPALHYNKKPKYPRITCGTEAHCPICNRPLLFGYCKNCKYESYDYLPRWKEYNIYYRQIDTPLDYYHKHETLYHDIYSNFSCHTPNWVIEKEKRLRNIESIKLPYPIKIAKKVRIKSPITFESIYTTVK